MTGFLWSVNPDNDSVSVFNVSNDANTKIAEIPVGKEPWCVAITPDDCEGLRHQHGKRHRDGDRRAHEERHRYHPRRRRAFRLRPDARTAGACYVANQSSDTVSVINTRTDRVIDTISGVGSKPHGLAITADGSTVFVTQFLALKPADDARPATQSEGADDGREGRVTVIDADTRQSRRTWCV